ncbi:hypothetical protein N7495_007408 [Penicillium taxi]|uniref:uncharacterized protein n=1 Tax=Penicillium taxi TaxID=168475 RepID=UPI0025456400|nr:uncharacterized protein N7495_007408 [Penicillium taxi]KAJ5887367.1 hypothetical protein N7495_007408 [Penicillium taxi]
MSNNFPDGFDEKLGESKERPLIIYTNRSGIESKVGAAAVDKTGEHIALSQIGDNDLSTIYSIELRAIEIALKLVLNSNKLYLI